MLIKIRLVKALIKKTEFIKISCLIYLLLLAKGCLHNQALITFFTLSILFRKSMPPSKMDLRLVI
jgi:hypothetical protein